MERFTGLLGADRHRRRRVPVFEQPPAIQPRVIYVGLGLQFGFAFLVLKTPLAEWFKTLSNGVNSMLGYAIEGSKFVFGDKLGAKTTSSARCSRSRCCRSSSSSHPCSRFSTTWASCRCSCGPWRSLMQRVMGTSGAESTSVAASIFMGQTEAPLTIRPFLAGLTRKRAVHHHDQRHGARVRRGDGGLRSDRACRDTAFADSGDHDVSGHADAGQDPDAGNRKARDHGRRQDRSGEARGQRDRCGGARRLRRLAAGAEHRRDADRVSSG